MKVALGKPKPEKIEKKKRKYKKRPVLVRKYDEADRIVKMILMIRDWGICNCPEPDGGHSHVLQNGHLISRGKKSVRWDLWNTHLQCSSCNLLHEHQPEIFTKWFIIEFGSKRWLDLVERSTKVEKITEKDIDQIIAGLNSILISLQLNPDNFVRSEYYLTQEEIMNIGRIAVPD